MTCFGMPPDITLYKLLMDQGSFIGGVFALIAGGAAYIGARQAASREIAAMARKDRLQARGIVVAVSPELLQVQVSHDRALNIMRQVWPTVRGNTTVAIVQGIRSAKIEIPPLLARNVDNFFLVEPGGASLQQVVSFTLQYNGLIETLAEQSAQYVDNFDPEAHREALSGNLEAIRIAVTDAIREIGPIHDEATGA